LIISWAVEQMFDKYFFGKLRDFGASPKQSTQYD
jgi:hypothetical protein